MDSKTTKLIFLAIMFFACIRTVYSQTPNATLLIERMEEAEKVEQLYNVRYNLDKLSANNNLPIAEMRRVLEAHLILANEFKSRNHFRNAADVYLDYLKLAELFHKNYSNFLVDSVHNANNAEALTFKNNISELNTEIATLTKRNEIVSGLRSKYLTYGGIAAAIILLIFSVILLSRNKSIRETNQKITAANQQLKVLFEDVIKAGMLKGALLYSRNVMNDNAELIDEILENKDSNSGQKTDASTIKALNEAKSYFSIESLMQT